MGGLFADWDDTFTHVRRFYADLSGMFADWGNMLADWGDVFSDGATRSQT